jgi:GTPase SAR1 family protein
MYFPCIFQLQLWDTGGMERVGSITQAYFRNAHGAILCYNPANKESFNMLSEYILQVAMFSRNAKIFLCGTMADRRPVSMVGAGEDYVREEEIEEFERFCSTALSGVFKVSSRTGEGVNKMFMKVAEGIHRDRNVQTIMQQMEKRNSIHLNPNSPPHGKKSCCQ